ncbi:MAG TPA: CCA tRNA nucleotidyltransferase, partial [Acidimicrobiales bacterium]|nr:CCA tRNA nucleotidyltransferase [Acidimicrobiales bacterium]
MIPERLAPLIEEGSELAERFKAAGRQLYLVGGTVRDAIADPRARPGDVDLDFTTDAPPEQIEDLVRGWADAVWLQGKAFGTVGFLHHGRRNEITTHRAEAYRPDSRKPSVRFADDIEIDLSRRDFTVNAMALRLPDVELIDPFGGLQDLAERRLRTPLSPDVSFADDPLRMMRAARFIAALGLEPQAELVEAVHRLHDRLQIVSPERIRDELDKLLTVE